LNHTYLKRIKMRPVDVNETNSFQVWQTLYNDVILNYPNIPKNKLKVSDHVRIQSSDKLIFKKSYMAHFSQEIFVISKVVKRSNVFSYKLSDLKGKPIPGSFLYNNLLKVPAP
jgi:hypothetical protein